MENADDTNARPLLCAIWKERAEHVLVCTSAADTDCGLLRFFLYIYFDALYRRGWNTKESTWAVLAHSKKKSSVFFFFFGRPQAYKSEKNVNEMKKKTALVRQLGGKKNVWMGAREQQQKKKTRTDWKINTGRQCLWRCKFFFLFSRSRWNVFFRSLFSIFFFSSFFLIYGLFVGHILLWCDETRNYGFSWMDFHSLELVSIYCYYWSWRLHGVR